jgi:hypothetical protein
MLPALSCECDDCREDYAKWAQLGSASRYIMATRLKSLVIWADAMGYGPGTRIGKREAKRLGRLFYAPLRDSFAEFEDMLKARGGK